MSNGRNSGAADQSGSDGLPPLRDVISTLGLKAKKSLGQNFILDLNLTSRIARAAGPLEGKTIVEIGPGPGGLTRGLLMEGAGHVIAIERDSRALPALHDIAAAYPGRVTAHEGDALACDWAQILSLRQTTTDTMAADVSPPPARGGVGGGGRVKSTAVSNNKPIICANLPYGIATRLLIGWLEETQWPPWYGKMVLMFQKEVAERITAAPATKAYGRLAVIAQWRCQARILLTLPPAAFTPPPKVASAVVEFIPRKTPLPACSVTTLGQVTAAAFGQRRKMLRSSLKQLTPMPELLLAKTNINPEARAESLTVADFAKLAAAYDGGE